MVNQIYLTTGKRKCAIARAKLDTGSGEIRINMMPLENYFPSENLRMLIKNPLELTGTTGKYDISVNVQGGGVRGQAEAVRHSIAKALLAVNPTLRITLKKEGLLTRDSRVKERKKYGQKGARKRFQYSKR